MARQKFERVNRICPVVLWQPCRDQPPQTPAPPAAGQASHVRHEDRIGRPGWDEFPAHRPAGQFHRLEGLGCTGIDQVIGPHLHDAGAAVGGPRDVVRRVPTSRVPSCQCGQNGGEAIASTCGSRSIRMS
ncbi:hypothetical protein [Streptomyces zagrosensis]|uniref:Uncharacterized protein n=1 Tax=Streptomyces zagrosensis TaxID=1042984 RepID=A0A7W9V1R4_9ACTN|nr:hypothetical protein [Streptomyces zagrosensis]MBB5938521.1 hypothetical protein [Streptomyces zagrosensis]